MWLLTCNSAVYYRGMLYLHNDIFLSDIIGYDPLKFSQLYTPKMKSWVRHCVRSSRNPSLGCRHTGLKPGVDL